MDDRLGTREACDRLGITLRTLYYLIDTGQLPAFRHGRVIRLRREDVDRYGEGGDDGGALVPRQPRPSSPPSEAAADEPDDPRPAPVGVRPSVNLARSRPIGTDELDALAAAGWSVTDIASTIGARPERAARWPRAGVPNRWLGAVRRLAVNPGDNSTD